MSLIECGPVNTDFLVNLQKAELGDVRLQNVDKRTLTFYDKYLQHCGSIFQNSAQDTEDIVKVCSIYTAGHVHFVTYFSVKACSLVFKGTVHPKMKFIHHPHAKEKIVASFCWTNEEAVK